MLLRATLLAAIGLLTLPAQAQTIDAVNVATSTISSIVFNNGNIGGNCGENGDAFAFNGDEGLCGAGFLVGVAPGNVVGDGYILDATTGWTPVGDIVPATDFPYDGYDSGSVLTYANADNGLSVAHTVYFGEANPDVILHQYEVTNTGTAVASGLYFGAFADWDVGGAVFDSNLAFRDGNTLYALDPTGATDNVFGVAILDGGDLDGWDYNIAYPPAAGQPQDEAEMYIGMTTVPGEGDSYDGPDTRWVEGSMQPDLGVGETSTFVLGFAAGESEDDLLLNLALAQVAVAPVDVTASTFSTPTVTSQVLNNGNIGGDCSGSPAGFLFNGEDALCGGGFLVGLGADNVVGDAYILDTTTEWTPVAETVASTEFPYVGFDNGLELQYINMENSLFVLQNTYYGETYPDVVLHQFNVVNYGDADLDEVYLGVFHDFDVAGSAFGSNVAARDGSSIYVVDGTGASPNVFGVSILGQDLSGWDYFISYPPAAGQPQDEAEMYTGLSVPSPEGDMSDPGDQRVVQGTGPVAIAAGESATVLIAFGAGTSEAEFLQSIAEVAAVTVADEGDVAAATGSRLSAPFPNPTSSDARVTLALDVSESVRVSVVDVLGREVAVVHEGALAAGSNELTVSAAGLAPGLYVIRAEGQSFRSVQTLTLTR